MKNSKKTFLVLTFLSLVVFSLTYCTKDNQVLDLRKDTGTGSGTGSGSTLTSIKVSTAPGIDGVVDAMWANAAKLEFSVTVPDPSGDLFRGYVGNTIPKVSLRSMYDASNIYFLAEWTDPTQSLLREPWYFDPTSKRWKKESGAPTFTTPVTTPPTAA
ncbi:MAG: ethylbenzene dehydrogenase-related protein, partial [Bacteroidota bacterium]|nr:ethylbenzene dehydrogenase-related protein [Bacteroidota bacterium]